MIDLILKDIEDPYTRENFFRLKSFLDRQVWFEGDFQLYDVSIPSKVSSFKIRHGLTFIPADIITLAAEGDYNFYFRYNDFDKENIYVYAQGPVRIRFLAGKLKDPIRSRQQAGDSDYPLIAPGDILGSASPGFVYGAVNDKTAGFWLTSEGIPSNVVGIPVLFGDARVVQVAVGTEIEANYTIAIYQHEGGGVGLIELGQVPFTIGGDKRILVNVPVQYTSNNVQLAVRLLAGNTRNLKVSLVVKGSSI